MVEPLSEPRPLRIQLRLQSSRYEPTMEISNAVLVTLRRIIRATDSNARQLAKETSLTTSQLLVLQLLETQGEMTIGTLASQVNLNQATMTLLVDRLQKNGLVDRQRGQVDRRQVFVSLTTTGRKKLEQAPRLLQSVFLENFSKLAEWEQTYVLSALERVAHMMNAGFHDASPVLDIGAIDRDPEKSKES